MERWRQSASSSASKKLISHDGGIFQISATFFPKSIAINGRDALAHDDLPIAADLQTAVTTARGTEKHARKQKYIGNSTVNLLETKQFILTVKERWGTGGMGTVYGRGCGAKRDPAGGTRMNKANATQRNK